MSTERICEGCNKNKTVNLYKRGKLLCIKCEEKNIKCEKKCKSCGAQKPLEFFRVSGICVECDKNQKEIENVICEICNVKINNKTLKTHNLSLAHKKRQENKNFLENIIKDDETKNYSILLRNKNDVVIGNTIIDKKVYLHILENNYAVCKNAQGYASMWINSKNCSLHRYIYYDFYKNKQEELKPVIDHINSNRLDNRIENLRSVSISDNNRNRNKKKDGSSVYRGVTKHNGTSGWQCQVRYNGSQESFYYLDETHAAYHYDLLIKQYGLQETTPINNIGKPHNFILNIKIKKERELPNGIGRRYDRNSKYYFYTFKGKEYNGKFSTVDEALIARNNAIKKNEVSKQQIKNNKINEPIKRNSDDIAIIEIFNIRHEKVAETMVSDDMYHHLIQYKFHLSSGYPHFAINGKCWLLHRYIINYSKLINNKDIIDHIDNNILNNQTNNLRIITASGNAQNKNLANHGVSYDKERKKWAAQISVSGKNIHLKRWNTKEEAIQARDNYIIELRKANPDTRFKLSSEYTKSNKQLQLGQDKNDEL